MFGFYTLLEKLHMRGAHFFNFGALRYVEIKQKM